MAQHKVVDLVIQHGSVQIVQRSAPLAVQEPHGAMDLRGWLASTPGTWLGMIGVGAASAGVGMALSVLGTRVLTLMFANSMLSAGLCLLLLGLLKRAWARPTPGPAPAAEPPPVDAKLLAERVRRVRVILARASSASELFTFEQLVKESRWTGAAMLSTLMHMKERGEVVEDLNLDTGEWVYSLADEPTASGGTSLMLAERTAQATASERQG
jgi:hypothetical protein